MLVCWCFFNFAASFDFGCCSLAQEMSFVDRCLPYFRQWLITHLLSRPLPFQPLFTESLHEDQLLTPPPFSGVLTAPCPLCCVFLFSSLFIIQFFFTEQRRGQSAQGAMLIYPRGGWGNTVWCLVLTCLVCQMSPKQFRSWLMAVQEPSCFLSVTWHGAALYRLGVQGVYVLTLLGAFFLPSVAPAPQQEFWFTELTLSASAP
jgi:hypothetical protein